MTTQRMKGLPIARLLIVISLSGLANGNVNAADSASAVASEMIAKIQAAWNESGDVGLSMFTDDVDFINAFGPYWSGKGEVTKGTGNIKAAYKSVASYQLAHASEIAPGIILAVVNATATIPAGQPMAGPHPSTQSILFVKRGDEWKIRFLQTTPIAGPPAKPE